MLYFISPIAITFLLLLIILKRSKNIVLIIIVGLILLLLSSICLTLGELEIALGSTTIAYYLIAIGFLILFFETFIKSFKENENGSWACLIKIFNSLNNVK